PTSVIYPLSLHDALPICRGGMGCVTLAREEKGGRAVAIKTLLPEFAVSDKAMRRFLREVDVAAALKHPNIVEFIDRGVHNGVVRSEEHTSELQSRGHLVC